MSLSEKIMDINHVKMLQVIEVIEFIKFEKARRENQLRIHWCWLKKQSYKEVVKFLNSITDKKAGEKLI